MMNGLKRNENLRIRTSLVVAAGGRNAADKIMPYLLCTLQITDFFRSSLVFSEFITAILRRLFVQTVFIYTTCSLYPYVATHPL